MIISKRKKPRPGRLGRKDMQKLREDVFTRDGFRCQHVTGANNPIGIRCLKPVTWESGHLCHIVSRGAGGHDTAENTYCGCSECHMKFHAVGPSMTKPVPAKG